MNGELNSWDKFCNYLWFDKKLNIWLDISKINFTNEEIVQHLRNSFIENQSNINFKNIAIDNKILKNSHYTILKDLLSASLN